tara:strand:+ start:5899 stop:6204 length:306 start_codon:yes stop_codon:yes gene_type:complete
MSNRGALKVKVLNSDREDIEEFIGLLLSEIMIENFPSEVVMSEAMKEVADFMEGDRLMAAKWLSRPCRALGYKTPLSVLCEPDGLKQVKGVLQGLAYGYFL